MDRARRSRSTSRLLILAPAILAALVLGGVDGNAAPARQAAKTARAAVPGELLIGFRDGVSSAEERKVLAKIGAVEKKKFKRIRGAMVGVKPESVGQALEQLRSDDRVRYAEPNFIVHADALPNDPSFSRLWGLNNTGQVGGVADADIDAPEAWNVTTGSNAVTVAVIDTGVDYTHPDLISAISINPGEDCAGCRTDGRDNDGNGYVDDWRGWDFVNDDNAPADDHGHGTHVAGTIGATGDNGTGVTGVNWRVRVLPLKFLSASGTGSTDDAVSAVLYAAAQGADVLNNSWAGDEYSQALADAIGVADADNSLFVAAAGNDGSDNDAQPTYPAAYDLPDVVSVAATDSWDGLAYFSNTGRRSVDLGAPGVNIYSTWPGNSYQSLSGTSMAAPHVSGAAALAKAAFPAATDLGLKALLLGSVDPKLSLADRTATGGRLNAATAVGCNGRPKIWFESPAAGFTVDAGSPVTISAIATRCADASGVTVTATANGTSVVLTSRGDGLYSGTYTPPASGPVSISVTASASGTTDTRTVSGVASQAYTITPGGPSVTVTTSAPNENARLRFDGRAGQRVSLNLAPGTIAYSYVSILKTDGSPLGSSAIVYSFGGFVDTRTLPATGSYTILVDPQGSYTGSMTLTLYDVPPDAGGPLAFGTEVTASTSTPGQDARYTFNGQAGQRVSVKLAPGTITYSSVSILKPDGSALGGSSNVNSYGGFLDTRTLPSPGTYTLLIDPQGAYTGSMPFSVYDVPPDAGGPIAFGSDVTVSTTTPGQDARYTFAGQPGQRVSVKLGTGTITSSSVSILKPDGSVLGASSSVNSYGGFVDTRTLPSAGMYTLLIDPQGAYTGSMTVTLYDVPPDVTGTLLAGGPSVTTTIATPGQNARLGFDGRAGQRVSLKLSGGNISSSTLAILKPDGSALGNTAYAGSSGGFIDTRTLPVAGTYTVVFDPQGAATGSMSLTLYDVPADAAGTITPGGMTAISTATPGQNARVAFAGQAGQRVSLKVTASSISSSYVSILKPDGSALGGSAYVGSSGFLDARTLPAAGTYTILVDPNEAATGSMMLRLYDIPPDAAGNLVIGGPSVTVSTSTPGQNARVTFDGRAGQRVTVRFSNVSVLFSTFAIIRPGGGTIASSWVMSSGRTVTVDLPVDGSYVVVIDPQDAETGSMTLTASL